jgi:hypothetical protein
MPEPYADTLATLAAGRTALVARLRTLATRVEELPLDAAAEVLLLLGPAVDTLERQAALALERAPAVSSTLREEVVIRQRPDQRPSLDVGRLSTPRAADVAIRSPAPASRLATMACQMK